MDTILPINRIQTPPGFCGGAQQIADFITQNLQVLLPGTISFFIISPDEPSVEFRDRLWVKTDAATNTVIGYFTYSPFYGKWLANHWQFNGGVPPTNKREIFTGSLTDLETYDGGESGTVSDTTGPFWEQDTVFSDTWPLGIGATIPTPLTTAQVFTVTTPADPKAIGVYFIKPTGRIYDRGN